MIPGTWLHSYSRSEDLLSLYNLLDVYVCGAATNGLIPR